MVRKLPATVLLVAVIVSASLYVVAMNGQSQFKGAGVAGLVFSLVLGALEMFAPQQHRAIYCPNWGVRFVLTLVTFALLAGALRLVYVRYYGPMNGILGDPNFSFGQPLVIS